MSFTFLTAFTPPPAKMTSWTKVVKKGVAENELQFLDCSPPPSPRSRSWRGSEIRVARKARLLAPRPTVYSLGCWAAWVFHGLQLETATMCNKETWAVLHILSTVHITYI